MSDTKISAMPAATTCVSADIMPLVQSAVNKKVTRTVLLTCEIGDAIYLNKGASGKVGIKNAAGTFLLEIDGADNFSITNSAGSISIGFLAGNAADWAGAPPSTIETAIDRIAASLSTNFPLLPKP